MVNKKDYNEWFKLLIKKENPDLYYKALDIIDIAKKKRNKIQECTSCGYIYVGRKPEDCKCKKVQTSMLLGINC